MYQAKALAKLADRLHAAGYNIWCYTGFMFDDLLKDADMFEALRRCDVVVDGPFIMPLRDVSLRFRGSSNQRLIDVAATLSGNGSIALWHD